MTGAVLAVAAVAALVRVDVLRARLALRPPVRACGQPVLHDAAGSRFRTAPSITRCMCSTFFAGFFPWSIVALGGAVDAFRRWRARVEISPEEILLWVWVGVVFIFFSLARFKVDRYVYPAAPACCLLAARAWMSVSVFRPDLAGRARQHLRALVRRDCSASCSSLPESFRGFSLFNLGLDLPPAALLIPISLAVGGVALDARSSGAEPYRRSLFGAVLLMLLVIYGCVVAIGLPVLERARPTAAVADSLRSTLAADDQVALYRLENGDSAFGIISSGRSAGLQHPEDVRDFFTRQGRLHSDARRGFCAAAQGRHQPAGRQRAARGYRHDRAGPAPAEVGLAGRGHLRRHSANH